MENLFSIEDKVIVLTGACGLIGKSMAQYLESQGAIVIACDISISDDFWGADSKCEAHQFDVTDEAAARTLAEALQQKYGRIDGLINNAAINDKFEDPISAFEQSKFENYPIDLWKKSIEVNLTSVFVCSKTFGTIIAKSGGSIVNTASTYGIVGPDQKLYVDDKGEQQFHKSPSYPSTKGGVVNFTRFLAAYWGEKGVRVNTLSPGGVFDNHDEWFNKNYSQRTCLGRMASPADYHGPIHYLLSDASRYMTGANLIVDGGWTAI